MELEKTSKRAIIFGVVYLFTATSILILDYLVIKLLFSIWGMADAWLSVFILSLVISLFGFGVYILDQGIKVNVVNTAKPKPKRTNFITKV